jgi:hypothetical protein
MWSLRNIYNIANYWEFLGHAINNKSFKNANGDDLGFLARGIIKNLRNMNRNTKSLKND